MRKNYLKIYKHYNKKIHNYLLHQFVSNKRNLYELLLIGIITYDYYYY